MLEHLLFQLALGTITIRAGYMAIKLIGRSSKNWLDILYYIAIVIVALVLLL